MMRRQGKRRRPPASRIVLRPAAVVEYWNRRNGWDGEDATASLKGHGEDADDDAAAAAAAAADDDDDDDDDDPKRRREFRGIQSRFLRKRRERLLLAWASSTVVMTTIFWKWIVRGYLLPLPAYRSRLERRSRRYRFPSIEERVRLYMSDWYRPICATTAGIHDPATKFVFSYRYDKGGDNNPVVLVTELPMTTSTDPSITVRRKDGGDDPNHHSTRTFELSAQVQSSVLFYYRADGLRACARKRWPLAPYCADALATMGARRKTAAETRTDGARSGSSAARVGDIPILLQFGDEDETYAKQRQQREERPKQRRRDGFGDDPPTGGAPSPVSSLSLYPRVPHVKKFRRSLPRRVVDGMLYDPSVSKSRDAPSSTCTSLETLLQQRRRTRQPIRNDGVAVVDRNDRIGADRNVNDASSLGDGGGGGFAFLPILWKLNTKRHYRDLYLVPRYDRRWERKYDRAVFRGALTGVPSPSRRRGPPGRGADDPDGAEDGDGDEYYRKLCRSIPRCDFVLEHSHSPYVDAKLTKLLDLVPPQIRGDGRRSRIGSNSNDGGDDNDTRIEIGGMQHTLSMKQMLQYKGIVILEGNDVSSGLKWALLSQSVVLMTKPQYTSWAMEELLEPWVHYIPLEPIVQQEQEEERREAGSHDSGTATTYDVEGKVRWMVEHSEESKRIARRATLWILDLAFHPDSDADDRKIYDEILARYEQHFVR